MDWNYIAGFFDGEGSISNFKGRYRITLPQTNLEVLEEIRKFTKVGFIIIVTKRQSHWKQEWVYYIAKQEDTLKFLKAIAPKLIVKRGLAYKAIPALVKKIQERKLREKRLIWRIKKCKELREKGLTYRAISKIVGIDWGYARRLDKFK